MIDLEETGKQIGEKLFALLTTEQKRELIRNIINNEMYNTEFVDVLYNTRYSVSQKVEQPLTEIRIGELYFCKEQRIVIVRDQSIKLTVKEFELLAIFITSPKRVFTYEILIELVWHEDYTFYSRKAINNHVSNLRKKLKIASDIPNYIKSVYGVGYKFDE